LYSYELIPVHADGRVDVGALKSMLSQDVAMVSCIYAQNEIGTVQPLREIAHLIKDIAPHVVFHSDAAQAPLYLTLDVHSLGLDMMSLNGGKMYGPKQSGCLYITSDVQIEPYIYGGGQERGLRSGTENVPSIMGFTAALVTAQACRQTESARQSHMQNQIIAELETLGGVVVGSRMDRLPNHIAVYFEGIDNERLTMQLDNLGFLVSAGSACHARTGSYSTVLEGIGMTKNRAQSVIRITSGASTTSKQLMTLVETIKKLLP
jgi:cysteine desulfurase